MKVQKNHHLFKSKSLSSFHPFLNCISKDILERLSSEIVPSPWERAFTYSGVERLS